VRLLLFLPGYSNSQYLCAFQEFPENRIIIVLLVGSVAIPGRSGFEPGVANPCGNLFEESVPRVLFYHVVHRGFGGD